MTYDHFAPWWIGCDIRRRREIRQRLAEYAKRIRKAPHLYAIRSGDYVKLGQGRSPQTRRSELQVGNPEILTLLGTVSTTAISEAVAHAQWSHLHHRGEWYRLTPELRAWINGWSAERARTARTLARIKRIVKTAQRRRPGFGASATTVGTSSVSGGGR